MELRVSLENLWDYRYAMVEGAKELKKACDAVLRRYSEAAALTASRLAPKRTGRLAASIRYRREGEMSYSVGSELIYAPFVECGTKPHVIKPVSAKVLAFTVGASRVFAKVVNHPGSKERPFLRQALKEIEPRLKAELAAEAEGLFRLKFRFR
ncbi:MAG: HK97 gp10 family phage protein [Thaumarchaeota archaeon]|jgi:HK97 gp10 family phage protein|nr:HK97 gp10 family phage protein [Nitrososphaerota archaeon]